MLTDEHVPATPAPEVESAGSEIQGHLSYIVGSRAVWGIHEILFQKTKKKEEGKGKGGRREKQQMNKVDWTHFIVVGFSF